MKSIKLICFKIVSSIIVLVTAAAAQTQRRARTSIEQDFTWWYVGIIFLFVALVIAVYIWYRIRFGSDSNSGLGTTGHSIRNSKDLDPELAWLKGIPKKNGEAKRNEDFPKNLPRTSRVLQTSEIASIKDGSGRSFDETKKKLQEMKFARLPINSFTGLRKPKPFDALPISDEDALMSAIEQTQCEDEDDPEIRELAVRILARFRTRNSIEALSQVAKYDVSSAHRAKAVSVLAEFDHPSVFETVLLCCADPSREVRAAAARALFTTSFDRADAWAAIAESKDAFRIVQAARAAIESDLVGRSIERLVHEDEGHAYEAFTLIALLIRAGETSEIFQILESHADQSVKIALLRVFTAIPDERTIPHLYSYLERNTLNEALGKAVNESIKSAELVPA